MDAGPSKPRVAGSSPAGRAISLRCRLTGFVEVFNALDANPVQNLSWETGAAFLRSLVIVPPRIVRAGFRLDW
jgi:hypothetical protein